MHLVVGDGATARAGVGGRAARRGEAEAKRLNFPGDWHARAWRL
jgi:hypothetical protein